MVRFRQIFSTNGKHLAVRAKPRGPSVCWALAGLCWAVCRGWLEEGSWGAGCMEKSRLDLCSEREARKGFSRPVPCFLARVCTLTQMGTDALCFSFCPEGHLEALGGVGCPAARSCQVVFHEPVCVRWCLCADGPHSPILSVSGNSVLLGRLRRPLGLEQRESCSMANGLGLVSAFTYAPRRPPSEVGKLYRI